VDTRITLYKLEVLCKVVEQDSVTRAAASLHVTQPVVTAHIRSLETRLGVKLFARHGRSLALTPAGQVAYRWASDVVRSTYEVGIQLDELAAEQQERVAVVVSIGAHPDVSSLVVNFQVGHPSATVNLLQLPTEQAVCGVSDRSFDFALVLYCQGAELDPSLRVERLREDEVILVTSAATTEPSAPVKPEELADLPFVCTPAGSARRRFIDTWLRDHGVGERRIVMEIRPEGTLHAAIRDGLGFALLSRSSVTAALAKGDLREVPMSAGNFPIGLDLISRHDLELSPTHGAFIHAARERLGSP
jgi:DNA-binding transcriptional LysR family regulator